MARVLRSRYADPRESAAPGDSVTLLEILDEDGSSGGVLRALHELRGLTQVSVDQQTDIIQVSVDAQSPALAAAVANRYVMVLADFNEQVRQSQAGQRRRFIETKVGQAQEALRETEEELRVFYERNRTWQQSPQPVFEEGRLRRVVDVRQEVYRTLMREYELARIEEVNEQPIITVIDTAVAPLERSNPQRRRTILLVAVLAGMVSVTWALIAAYLSRMRDGRSEGYMELTASLRHVRSNLVRAFRVLPVREESGHVAADRSTTR